MKKILLLSFTFLVCSLSNSFAQKNSLIGITADFSYMPHVYHSNNFGVLIEKEFASNWYISSGYNIENFVKSDKFYSLSYGNIPIYFKYSGIINVSAGLDNYHFLKINGFGSEITKRYNYIPGGGISFSKDFYLNKSILFEPALNLKLNNPAFNGFVRFGYGLKLKYKL